MMPAQTPRISVSFLRGAQQASAPAKIRLIFMFDSSLSLFLVLKCTNIAIIAQNYAKVNSTEKY